MTRILVLYYSSYGHIERMAYAQAEGVAKVPGVAVEVKRVPELVPPDLAKSSGFKLDQAAPVAEPEELEHYEGVIFGTPTRFGNMAAQMRNFLDRTGGLWVRNALLNKFGSVFCSTASQHGGQETTITSFHLTLLHHGMLIVGLPYKFRELSTMNEITGGSPYGASCVVGTGPDMRMPTELELTLCRYQGEHVASIVSQFVRGAGGRS
jgi:NAD(P)H dehydrogenase (quinone)